MVWSRFRRYDVCFSIELCFGVVELKHGVVVDKERQGWTHPLDPQRLRNEVVMG